MSDTNINKKVYGGYAVLALQNLGHSEKSIKDFLIELESVSEYVNEDTAFEIINNFLDGNTKKIIFEGIEIPKEYNLVMISELFEKHKFTDKKIKSVCTRVCNSFKNNSIICFKDLYCKNRNKLINMRNVGTHSYNIFVQTLKEILIFKN